MVGGISADIAKPDKKGWLLLFFRDNYGLVCYNDPNQPTVQYRLCLDLVMARNAEKVVAEPITV